MRGRLTCEVDFMVVGVFGERGPWEDAEGELGVEFTSSSTGGLGPDGTGIGARGREKKGREGEENRK